MGQRSELRDLCPGALDEKPLVKKRAQKWSKI